MVGWFNKNQEGLSRAFLCHGVGCICIEEVFRCADMLAKSGDHRIALNQQTYLRLG